MPRRLGPDPTSVGVGEPAHYCQPEACPRLTCDCRSALERLEDGVEILRRKADPVVMDGDDHLTLAHVHGH